MTCWASLDAGPQARPSARQVESKRWLRKQGLRRQRHRGDAEPSLLNPAPFYWPANVIVGAICALINQGRNTRFCCNGPDDGLLCCRLDAS